MATRKGLFSGKPHCRRWGLRPHLRITLLLLSLASLCEGDPPLKNTPPELMVDQRESIPTVYENSPLLPPLNGGLFLNESEPLAAGLEPDLDTHYDHRLLSIRSYEGDRLFYQTERRDYLWQLEPRATSGWNYDSNIFQTEANHVADWYQSLGAGLHFNLGKMAGSPEDLHSIFALETDYSVAQEWFVSNPNLDALNQVGRIDLRIGRDALIIRPYFTGNHITGTQLLESALSGRYASTNLEGGVIIEQALTPRLAQTMNYSWGQIDQQSNDNVGYELWKIYHELSYALISNQGRPQDLRYTTETSVFSWFSAQNASANNRSAQVHYLLGGVGFREALSTNLTFSSKMGWENIERGWDMQVGRDLSTFCLESNLRYDYDRNFALELFWNRGYQLSQSDDDDNYIDNYLTLAPTFKFAPGWQIRPAFSIGTTSTEKDEKTFYLVPSTEVAYELANQTKFKMKLEYDESRTIRGSGGDVIGWRSTFSVDLEF